MVKKFLPILLMLMLCGLTVLNAQTPGTQIDATTADAQNYYSSAQNQIYVDPETKKVYLGYTWSNQTDWSSYTARITNFTDKTVVDMPTLAAYGYGLPDIRKSSDGSLLVGAVTGAQGWFYYDNWANGVSLFKETGVGTATYDSLNWFNENPAGGPNTNLACWLQVDDDGVIHWMAYDGWGYIYLYKRSEDNGATFSEAVAIGGSYANRTSIDINFLGGDYPFGAALASDGKGNVAIAIVDQGGDIYVVESTDQGISWPEVATNVTEFGDGLVGGFGGEEHARPDRFIDAFYDKNSELHLVWEASYYLDDSQKEERHPWAGLGSLEPYLKDFKPELTHWSYPTGVTTAAQSLYPKVDLDDTYRLITGRSRGCMISSPTVAYDEENDIIYVGYTQYGEDSGKLMAAEDDPYAESIQRFIGYGELYVVSSSDNGASWSTPANITNSPSFDERHFILNDEVVDGKLHAFYIADNQPGYEFFGYFPPVTSGVYYYSFDPASLTGVADNTPNVADEFKLQSAYPNPFNPSIKIKFSTPDQGNVNVSVYNMLGQQVRTLVNGKMQAGEHEVNWDGVNEVGSRVQSGVYLLKVTTDAGSQMKKITLLK